MGGILDMHSPTTGLYKNPKSEANPKTEKEMIRATIFLFQFSSCFEIGI
jgi:hypothetical protein